MLTSLTKQIIILALSLHFSKGQIDTSQCGVTTCCFRFPDGCSGTSCDILIAFQYNKTGVLDIAIGTKETWVAFGVNSEQKKMDATAGEVCYRTSPAPQLKGFSNSGTLPNFGVLTNGLVFKGNEVKNNFLVCRYTRPIVAPSGSYMLDMNNNMYITAAFGKDPSGSNPTYHGPSSSTTSSSPTKLDFKKPCSISGAKSSAAKVIAHGALMIVAWVCFAATGIFIARYTKPVSGEQRCLGEKVWFQSHRIFVVTALLLTIIGFIIIFVHRGGWSKGAGAHPILGCIVTFLAILQPIMAAFRPHPEEENRWVFNWAHRTVGFSALIISAATIMLGLDLFQVNKIAIIIWIAACVAFVIVMEIGIYVIGKSSSSAEFNAGGNTINMEVVTNDTSITFRKIVFLLAMVSFFALGFATVGLVAVKES